MAACSARRERPLLGDRDFRRNFPPVESNHNLPHDRSGSQPAIRKDQEIPPTGFGSSFFEAIRSVMIKAVALRYSSRLSFSSHLSTVSALSQCTRLNSGNTNNRPGGTMKLKKPCDFINNLLSLLLYLACGSIIPSRDAPHEGCTITPPRFRYGFTDVCAPVPHPRTPPRRWHFLPKYTSNLSLPCSSHRSGSRDRIGHLGRVFGSPLARRIS